VKKSLTTPLPGSLEATGREVRALGGDALVAKLDLSRREDWPAAIDAALGRFARIDVLVNNGRYVGPGHMDPFEETPIELIEQMMLCNVIAPLHLIKLCLPAMKRQGGGIVINITSSAGERETPAPIGQGGWGLGYSLSKAALNRMVPGLAKELRPYNIAVIGSCRASSGRSGWRPSSPSSASTRPRRSRSRTRAGCAPCSRPRRTPCTSRARTSTARASMPSTRSCTSIEGGSHAPRPDARLLDARPVGPDRPRAGGGAPRLRVGVDRGGVRLGRLLAALLGRRAHLAHQARHRHHAGLRAHAGLRRDDGGHHRPSLGRAARPRHRRVGPAGGRGLVRPALPEADGPHARVRPAAARDAPARGPGHVPGRALPAAPSRRRTAR